jgi:hypothetical protein
VGVTGRSREIYLYEASTMKKIATVADGNTCDIRMTSNHIFCKQADRGVAKNGWVVVSLKQTSLIKTMNGTARLRQLPKIQAVLYDTL